MTGRDRLRAVLDAFGSFGWHDTAGAAERVAAALPGAAPGDAASVLAAVLPADWLVQNRTTRAEAGRRLAGALPPDAGEPDAEGQEAASVGSGVDLVVVTALGLEHAAVQAHLAAVRPETGPLGTVYTLGRLGSADGPIAAVVQTGQGNAVAAAETERALARYLPRAVLFVGVAGGIKPDVPLGTVVAADHVYDYGNLAEDPDGLKGRIKSSQGSYRAVQAAQAAVREGDWAALRREPPSGWPAREPPAAVVKAVAAGQRLVRDRDGETATWLTKYCNDAAAVEMEGWGFLQAAYARPGIDALVVRGISDRLGDKSAEQDADWQPAAAANAAAFAVDVARRLLA